jgi:sugar lactone lactonase YvrE
MKIRRNLRLVTTRWLLWLPGLMLGFAVVASPTTIPMIALPVLPGDTIADGVLGQPDFFHNSANSANPSSLYLVSDDTHIAIDKSVTPNRIYVADTGNNRVLAWASVTALVNGQPANKVLGQPDLYSNAGNNGGISASSLQTPGAVAVDSQGNVYVADYNNNRVLEYNTPFKVTSVPGSGDAVADTVFGQGGSFNSNSCNFGAGTEFPSPDSLCNPDGVAVDSSNNLYISDYANNRVLEYSAPLSNGIVTAARVYGQGGNFFSSLADSGGITATSLSNPEGLAIDKNNELYIADVGNNRVLEFSTPLSSTTANHVFGQNGNFTTGGCNQLSSPNGALDLCRPKGVAVNASLNVYIADSGNNRVVRFSAPTSISANLVYGQAGNFNGTNCNNPTFSTPSATGLCAPTDAAVDTSNNLYVLDSSNNRVLKYNATPANNTTANVVLGQATFTHNTLNSPSATGLASLQGVAVDRSNHLYIADTNNNRVLGYMSATSFLNGAAAVLVIGQPDFESAGCDTNGTTASTLCSPRGVAVDTLGNLYVADSSNNRVLEYNTPFTLGGTADKVFGQTNFTNTGCDSPAVSASTICTPTGVALDSAGDLYIADTGNNRVLEIKAPLTTGKGAGLVFGQGGSFTTNTCDGTTFTPSANTLCEPTSVALDSTGDLYVADSENERVLGFKPPFASNPSADQVFGQQNLFNTRSCNATTNGAENLCNPSGVAVDAFNDLYVADTSNSRVVEFHTPRTVTAVPGSGDNVADTVFGQGNNFFSTGCNFSDGSTPSPDTLCRPTGAAVDTAADLIVADNSNNRALQYLRPLAGPITASPSPVAFANQTHGTTSAAKVVTFTNRGDMPLTVGAAGVTLTGTGASSFSQTNTCAGTQIPARKTCTASITFHPATTGAKAATLQMIDNATNTPQMVTLTGTGT